MTLVKWRVTILVLCLVCTFSTAGLAQPLPSLTPLLDSTVATNGDLLTLPVIVGSKKYLFAVDTGGYITTLDRSFRPQLVRRKPPANSTHDIYRESDKELFWAPAMKVLGSQKGRIEFPKSVPVALTDLEEVRKSSSFEIMGILCMDFLERYVIELDLHRGRLALFDSASVEPKPEDQALQLLMHKGRPIVEVASPGLKYLALIDTGALASVYLDTQAYQRLLKTGTLKRLSTSIAPGTRVLAKSGRLYGIKMGPFVHHGLLAVGPHRSTLLGLYYWRRYYCTFDFPKKRVYLQPSPYFALNDDSNRCGISVKHSSRPGGRKWVEYVLDGSLGEKAGIEAGDWLVSLNGQSAANMSIEELNRRLSLRTQRMQIVVRRDGDERQVWIPSPKETTPASRIISQ